MPSVRGLAIASIVVATIFVLISGDIFPSLLIRSLSLPTTATQLSTAHSSDALSAVGLYGELAPGVPDHCGFSVRRTHPPNTYTCLEYITQFAQGLNGTTKWKMHEMVRHIKSTPGVAQRGAAAPPPTIILADDEDLHDCYMALMLGTGFKESSKPVHPSW
jgi:hypothetical protein